MSRGQRQREVITAIERALGAIEAGDAAGVESAASKIQELNELAAYDAVPQLLLELAGALRRSEGAGVVATLGELEVALGPGPLGARLHRLRERLSRS